MKTLFCLMGPTACGKTDLAISLCELFPFEIISVDSAMVYKGMNIGTAKPDSTILEKFPHHLINIREPNQTYSAADFCQDVAKSAEEIFKRNKIPLLVGGTMLYFKALQQGLSTLPSADPIIREKILNEAATLGWQALHEQLQKVDPMAAARIHPNDPQRIERALEVYYLTGKPLSEYFNEKEKSPFHYISIGLFPENRELLHQRIEQRFKQMLAAGWIDEVKNLLQTGQLDFSYPAMRMVGYRQMGEYLNGTIDEKTMIEKGIIATRQLAKRQMTWLRHWPDITLMNPFQGSIFEQLCQQFKNFNL
jgi:tRNA dimethylallyltransferase